MDSLSSLREGQSDELSNCDDSGAAEMAQLQQVFVLSHNEIRLRRDGAFEATINGLAVPLVLRQ